MIMPRTLGLKKVSFLYVFVGHLTVQKCSSVGGLRIIFLLSLFGIRLPIICNLLLNKKVKSDVHVLRRIIGTIIQVGGLHILTAAVHNWPFSLNGD